MYSNNGGPPGSYGSGPGGFGPPPDGDPYRQGISVTRGTFMATGAAFIGIYLLLKGLPVMAGAILGMVFGVTVGPQAMNDNATYNILSGLINLTSLPLGVIYSHELLKFEWSNAVLDGRKVQYRGDIWQFMSALAVPAIVSCCTLGIYTPWLMCAYYRYIFEHSDAEGERLEFAGTGGDLFGVWLLNGILTFFTLGIYWPWASNNLWEWYWQRTGLNGRPFAFRRDGGDFFGVALSGVVLTLCTFGLYWPWAAASFRKWELEHVS